MIIEISVLSLLSFSLVSLLSLFFRGGEGVARVRTKTRVRVRPDTAAAPTNTSFDIII